MCLFGSKYWCEKLFLTMNFNKMQVQVHDAHLEAVFRVSTRPLLGQIVAQLCEQMHCQSIQGFH